MMSSNRTMAGWPPLFEDPGRRLADACGRVRRTDAARGESGRRGAPVSREDQDGHRADGQAEEDVVRLVADHVGRSEVQPELAGRPDDQAGTRVGTRTSVAWSARGVGTGIDRVE